MQEVIEWLKTSEGERWTQNMINPVRRYEWFTDRQGAFADIEPISWLGDFTHAYRPIPEEYLKEGYPRTSEEDLPHMYEPEKLPSGLSCPA